MKEKIPLPAAIGVAVVVLGILSFFLYRQFMTPPEKVEGAKYRNPMDGMKYEDIKGKINREEMKKRYSGGGQ